MELHLVADTNLFFECNRLEDLPWHELDGDPVVVLLTKPVLDEIDKHKTAGGRTRKRALDIWGRVRDLLKTGASDAVVREAIPRVVLRLMAHVPPSETLRETLDYQNNDDRLIGILSTLSQKPESETTALFTHDTGPASTARALDLPFRLIEDHWTRPPEETPEAKRIRELEKNLEKYRSQEPRINLRHNADDNPGSVRVVRRIGRRLTGEEIGEVIGMLRAKHAMKDDFTPPSVETTADYTLEPPIDEDIKRYQQESYLKWLDRCREVLANLHEDRDEPEERIFLRWAMSNDGNRPASQVRIQFQAEGPLALRRYRTKNDHDVEETMHKNPGRTPLPKLPLPPTPPPFKKINRNNPGSDKIATASLGSKYTVRLRDPKNNLGGMILERSALDTYLGSIESIGKLESNNLLKAAVASSSILDEIKRQLPDLSAYRSLSASKCIGGLAAPSLEIPVLHNPISIPKHDPEAFHYDDWELTRPVRKGALTCDLWRHKGNEVFFEFEVVFRSNDDVAGAVVCSVHAENLTEPASLRITVSRKVEERALLDEARQMVADCG